MMQHQCSDVILSHRRPTFSIRLQICGSSLFQSVFSIFFERSYLCSSHGLQ